MFSCQCHQIGGPFIAEDPDCPAHGTEAQAAARREEEQAAWSEHIASKLELAPRVGSSRT